MAAAIGSIVIEEIIKHAVSKLDNIWEMMNYKYDKYLIPKRENFEEYLNRKYKEIYHTKPRILSNSDKCLKDIYVPLTLVLESPFNDSNEGAKEFRIDCFHQEFKEYKKMLIEDDAGMGKSTMSKILFLYIVENGNWGIPIFVELRRLSTDHTLLDEILDQLKALYNNTNKELILDFFQEGGFIFFFDGYDEVALNHRQAVTEQLKNFINRASNNVFFVTSRKEDTLSCFSDFRTFRVKPLEIDEAYSLLRKYDEKGVVSKKLIEKLKGHEYENVKEFMKNPLLVSLLFTAFDYKEIIPLQKNEFYRQVFEAFFDKHDLSKDGYERDRKTKLSRDEFDRLLRRLGFYSVKKQIFEYSTDEFLKLIDDTKNHSGGLLFDSSNLIYDLLQSVPLFNKVGIKYGWCHKSMAEYFAAEYIYKDAKNNQSKILQNLYSDKNNYKYYNLLDLYYDIDPCGFGQTILLPCIIEYQKYIPENETDQFKDLLFRYLYKQDYLIYIKTDYNGDDCATDAEIHQLIKDNKFIPYEKVRNDTSIYYESDKLCIYIGTIRNDDVNKRLFLSILEEKRKTYVPNITLSSCKDTVMKNIQEKNINTNDFIYVTKDTVNKMTTNEAQCICSIISNCFSNHIGVLKQDQCTNILRSIEASANDPILDCDINN